MSTYKRLTTDLLPHLWQPAYMLASKRYYHKDTLQYPESCWKSESTRKPAEVKGLAQGRCLLMYCSWRRSPGRILHTASTEGADRQQHFTCLFQRVGDMTARSRPQDRDDKSTAPPTLCPSRLGFNGHLQLNLTFLCRACGDKRGCCSGCLRAPGCGETA